MFFRRKKVVTVPVGEYTDYSKRFAELEKERSFATKKDLVIISAVPAAASIGLVAHRLMSKPQIIEQTTTPITQEVVKLTETYTPLVVNAPTPIIPDQTNIIADKSLEILATALDPVIQILVAISFPIASVIMVGACFFFMLGNSERAWNMIMNAGLGYVLINLSPLFLEILRQIGKAVQ